MRWERKGRVRIELCANARSTDYAADPGLSPLQILTPLILLKCYEIKTIILILQMRNLRHRKIKQVAQGHMFRETPRNLSRVHIYSDAARL